MAAIYTNFINILKLFIRAERTGDLNLHLVAVGKMLNVFAAGHFNYAKSARLYLQMMLELPSSHPWLYIIYLAMVIIPSKGVTDTGQDFGQISQ